MPPGLDPGFTPLNWGGWERMVSSGILLEFLRSNPEPSPPLPLLQEHELPDWGSLPVGGCRIWVQIQPRNGHREPLQGGLKPWECPFGSAVVPVPTVLEQDAARGRLPSLP